jgi:hypothetical protein
MINLSIDFLAGCANYVLLQQELETCRQENERLRAGIIQIEHFCHVFFYGGGGYSLRLNGGNPAY